MQIPVPHTDPQSLGAQLAALAILYQGSLAAALAAAKKRVQ